MSSREQAQRSAFSMIAGCLAVFCTAQTSWEAEPQQSMDTYAVVFSRPAQGGKLGFGSVMLGPIKLLEIETARGEPPESVVKKLAEAAKGRPKDFGLIEAAGASLVLPGSVDVGTYYFCGTEIGLGIPEAVRSVTAHYNQADDSAVVSWRVPQQGYERQVLLCNGFGVAVLDGSANHYSHAGVRRGRFFPGRKGPLRYVVIAYLGSVPSGAAGIRIQEQGVQEEALDLGFCRNVAPNWTAWGNAAPREATRRVTERSVVPKTRYQVIAGSGPSFDGGIYREFLGLEPAKTYKVSVRVNTLDMDRASGEWSYAVYAAPNAPGDAPLAEEVLAGRAPLPSGKKADEAARIVEYTAAAHTDSEWVKVSTADASLPGKTTGNITLPPGVTAITVWLRHKGRGVESSGVGMDWIALEEVPR